MGSRIINYYLSTEANEDKDELGRGASNNRRRARLPRHLQRLQNRENDANDRLVPKFPEGQTVVLEPTDESPFLGDIPPGETQPCMSNNLYRVPLFEQRTLGNDFLLIREALPREKGDGAEAASKRSRYRCYVREMPRVYIAGQQEPQKAVPFPSKKTTSFQHDWIRLHIARYLKRVGAQMVTLYELQQRLFKSTYFPSAAIRKVMRELADGPDQHAHYQKKPDAQFPNIDELEKQISVEEVCLYECSAAGEKQLESYGIQEMRSPTIVASALDRLVTLYRVRKQRAEQARTAARQLKNTPRGPQAEKLAEVLERDAARTDRMIKIARFIHEKLLLTPWNLTGEFVQGHLQAQGTGMLQLTGIGDPSGRGEAFSYLRSSRQKAKRKSSDLQAEQWMKQITGTSEDLRKLTVEDMSKRLIQIGIHPQEVKSLKRWDLVHLIREHANKAVGAGQEHALTKFARGSKLNHAAQLADYKTICNRIWGYQQAALSSLERPVDDIEGDEDEEGEDVDEWEKDMLEGLEQGRPSQGVRLPCSSVCGRATLNAICLLLCVACQRGAGAGGEEQRIFQQWQQELRQDEAAKLSAQVIISSEEQKEPETRVPLIRRPKKVR
jgi:transcription initiation factor TFIID subunit 1